MESDENITLNKQISGDQDGDATLIGGVLTQHAERLFEMTASQDDKVRLATVDLLGQLLRQGLLNPMDAVPHLFALQGDIRQPQNRSLSLKLLITEAEKRPDMIRQRVCAGVKQAYIFQRAVYPAQVDPTAVVRRKSSKTSEIESIFSDAFVECIRTSKKQRHGLYLNLLSLFDIEDHSHHPSSPGNSRAPLDLPLLSFAAEVLAHLPYNTAGDPLFLIHHISSVAALQGAQVRPGNGPHHFS
jgi:cohesin loading factor subunit SCC2